MRLDDLGFADMDDVVDWRNAVRSSLRTFGVNTSDDQYKFWKSLKRRDDIKYYAILEDREKKVEDELSYDIIGVGGLTDIQWANGIAEIAILLNPKFRGNGHGEAVVDLILAEAFENMGLKTVYGECYACSDAINFWQRMAKKREWYTTTLPRRKLWYGRLHDALYFSIEAEPIQYARAVFKTRD